MKVSIITVVYNNEKTIENSVLSVLSQSYNNIEYIIIDGGSNDNTITIIEQYSHRLGGFVSEKDEGIYDAMNKGIRLATGDIIGILNSDDLYNDTEIIANVVAAFCENRQAKLVYGDLVYVLADDTDKVVRRWTSKKYFPRFFEQGNVPPHPALFVAKEVYLECGLFEVNFKLAADYDFMLRAFKKYGTSSIYLKKLMVRMRLGGATNKSLLNILKGNAEIVKSWKINGLRVPLMLMPYRIFRRLIQFI